MKLRFSPEENFRKNSLFLSEKKNTSPAFSADGYIENQKALSEMPYAAKDSAYCGCGWIALWNICRASGKDVFAPEIIREAEKTTILSGILGTNPFSYKRLIAKFGFSSRLCFSKKRFIKKCPEKGIIMFLRRNLTGHYISFCATGKTKDGFPAYRFYNAGFTGEELSLPEFFRRQKTLITFCYEIK